jgi:MYXO-CTERM domain-containing protein
VHARGGCGAAPGEVGLLALIGALGATLRRGRRSSPA